MEVLQIAHKTNYFQAPTAQANMRWRKYFDLGGIRTNHDFGGLYLPLLYRLSYEPWWGQVVCN